MTKTKSNILKYLTATDIFSLSKFFKTFIFSLTHTWIFKYYLIFLHVCKRKQETLSQSFSTSCRKIIFCCHTGTCPNIARNCIINVGETVVYDSAKNALISNGYFRDGTPCHFSAAVIAGFCATLLASPVDVIKTRYRHV